MIIAIHQPEHMPWLGFFNKAMNCDTFVLLDTVQYEKNYFQNRNQIISNKQAGREWLTVPVKRGKHTDLICEKQAAFDKKTRNRYLQQIHRAYSSYPLYSEVISPIVSIINDKDAYLSNLNIKLIMYFFDLLSINCNLAVSSELGLGASASGGIVNYHICKQLGATTYLSGVSGKDYLDETIFLRNNILVEYQNYNHPKYPQPRPEFVFNLSILDLVFSLSGGEAIEVIKTGYRI